MNEIWFHKAGPCWIRHATTHLAPYGSTFITITFHRMSVILYEHELLSELSNRGGGGGLHKVRQMALAVPAFRVVISQIQAQSHVVQ